MSTDADLERLRQLAGMLRLFKERVRYVGYQTAEEDCEALAAKILQEYPRSELDMFSFTAIPRGGLIVLGMLSYALGLRPDQLRADLDAFRPLVIVDDCALTGARLAGQLARVRSRKVVFVHLYSHPDFRRAVLDREERVMACLAARDLAGIEQPFAGAEERRAWEDRWRERLGESRRRLQELYEVDAETAARDVAAFAGHLAGAGLLERHPRP